MISIGLVLLVIGTVAIIYVYKKYMNLPAKSKCKLDMQCTGGACGRATAADGAQLECCAGEKTTYAGYDYCKNMPNGSKCWSDAMCANGDCEGNDYGVKKGHCSGHLAVGAPCDSNKECENLACGRETAADGAPTSCCKSGQTSIYGGFDYCKGMPNGATCWSDAMCAGNYCQDNNGGLQKGVCQGHLKVGEKCDSNAQCLNKACARETAADGALKTCCKSGAIAHYMGFDYCTDMEEGAVCWSDAQCANSYCEGNHGGLQKGHCRGHLPVDATCVENRQCLNSACARETAADGAPTQCCPSGATAVYDTYDYCTNMKEGAVCWSDAQCANGYCEGNAGGTKKGHCRGHLNVDDTCESNRQCLNSACGRESAADGAPLQCCPSGSIGHYGGYDYCANMKEGAVCWSDAQCANQFCEGNTGGTQKGVCRGNLGAYQYCTLDRQCANGNCGSNGVGTGNYCCANGQYNYWGEYCTGLGGGSVCKWDRQCNSGNCHGNRYGTRNGHCD